MSQLFEKILSEAKEISTQESLLAPFISSHILNKNNLENVLAAVLSSVLQTDLLNKEQLNKLFIDAFTADKKILESATKDLQAVLERDPATTSYTLALICLKGFQSIQIHRLAHYLWKNNRKSLALAIQSANALRLGVDIHPACVMGHGIMLDHATGIVIGETSVIEDNVSILQGVTLGGTGKDCGDRHPKIRSGVMIGVGSIVLGNIEIGAGSKIGAGSVVLTDVAPHTTVVGVPAKVIGKPTESSPAEAMNQNVFKDEN